MSFARHQSFYIRDNWFAKAIEHVKSNPRALSESSAAANLGIGKNMVESLRFWLIASKLASPRRDGLQLTRLGELVERYDPYFEDDMTWLLIHYGLTSDPHAATSWYLLFNRYTYPQLTEGEFVDFVKNENGYDVAGSSVKRDYDCLLATYVQDQAIEGTPEDNMTCPLRKYRLLERVDKDVYRKVPCRVPLPPELLYYVIRTSYPTVDYHSIMGLIDGDRNIGRTFNLSIDQLYFYLQKVEDAGLARYSITAGVNSVALESMDEYSVLRDYYRRVSLT